MIIKTQLKGAAGLLIFATVVGTALLWSVIVHGQPASAPVTQPAGLPAISVGSGWLVANWPALAGLIGWLLANLATALSEYPQAKDATTRLAKVIRFIRLFAAALGMVHFKNSGGVGLALKAPTVPIPEAKLNPPGNPV